MFVYIGMYVCLYLLMLPWAVLEVGMLTSSASQTWHLTLCS